MSFLTLHSGCPFHEDWQLILLPVLNVRVEHLIDSDGHYLSLLQQVCRLSIRVLLGDFSLNALNKFGIEQVGTALIANLVQFKLYVVTDLLFPCVVLL